MPALRFLADMHISPLTVSELRREGWDIARVSDVMNEDASDLDILAFAREQGQVVVTQDLDFSALLAIGRRTKPSVVSFRLRSARPANVTRRLRDVVADMGEELAMGAVISVDEASARYHLLPISLESK